MKRLKKIGCFVICFGLFGCGENYTKSPTDQYIQNPDEVENSETFQRDIPALNMKQITLDSILQNPELPTGCEITSLTMVFNYYGFSVNKLDLADHYLNKGLIGETDFKKAFVGNPRDKHSYGCYAPVIVECAKKYIKDQESSLQVIDKTGSSIEDLFNLLNQDIPIIVWCSVNMEEPYKSVQWNVDGKKLQWLSKEHCLVLTGYDRTKNIVYVNDPLKGSISYNADSFEQRYKQMFSQAVVIR